MIHSAPGTLVVMCLLCISVLSETYAKTNITEGISHLACKAAPDEVHGMTDRKHADRQQAREILHILACSIPWPPPMSVFAPALQVPHGGYAVRAQLCRDSAAADIAVTIPIVTCLYTSEMLYIFIFFTTPSKAGYTWQQLHPRIQASFNLSLPTG